MEYITSYDYSGAVTHVVENPPHVEISNEGILLRENAKVILQAFKDHDEHGYKRDTYQISHIDYRGWRFDSFDLRYGYKDAFKGEPCEYKNELSVHTYLRCSSR